MLNDIEYCQLREGVQGVVEHLVGVQQQSKD